jgi:hypothetical protein
MVSSLSKTFHVVFDGKVLHPEEELDLKPDTRYIITIERDERVEGDSLWDVLSKLAGTVEGPQDWSEEHDHYLYGTSKRAK